MPRTLLVALALAACSPDVDHTPPDVDDTPWWLTWSYRRPIDLAPPPGASTDILIALALDTDALAGHWNGTFDITTDDGQTVLGAEATDPGEIWIRLPALDGPTRLYLYYGVDTITDPGPPAIWRDYAAVWHLSSAQAERDSAHQLFELAPAPGLATSAPGIAGRARAFDGVDDGFAIGGATDVDLATRSFTCSLWVKESQALSLNDTPLYNGGTGLTAPGFSIVLGTGAWTAQLNDGATGFAASLGTEVASQWRHLVAVVDRESRQLRTYVDGSLTDTVAIATLGSLATPEPFQLGRSATDPFRGSIDEVRLYPGVLPDARIAAEFATLATPSMTTLGREQARP